MRGLFERKLEKISKEIFEKYPSALSDLIGTSHGVYALYDEDKLYYVGKASDLKRRIKQHLKDRHFAQWTHFSLFLTSKSAHIVDIESVLIAMANPRGNKAKPKGTADAKLRKELEALVKKRQEEERKMLFGSKKLSSKSKVNSKSKRQKSKIKHPSLANMFSSARPLLIKHKGKEYRASLLTSGKIRYGGVLYDAPSSAAGAVFAGIRDANEWMSKCINGWRYWYVKKENGNWVKLSELR